MPLSNRKTIAIIKTFSKKESRKFIAFLQSPYFNSDLSLISLYGAITCGELGKMTAEYLWSSFSELPFSEKGLRSKLSKLNKLAEEFLIQVALQNGMMKREELLLSELNRRKLDKSFHYWFHRSGKDIEKLERRNSHYLWFHFRREFERQIFLFRKNKLEDPGAMIQYFEWYYLIVLLRFRAVQVSFGGNFEVNTYQPFLSSILKNLDSENLPELTPLRVYWDFVRFIESPSDDLFEYLLSALLKNRNQFHPAEVYDLYLMFIGQLNLQILSGKTDVNSQLFDLMVGGLESGILIHYETRTVSPSLYKSICTCGLREGKFEWVSNFLLEYKGLLAPEYRGDAWNYNMANFQLYSGNYGDALQTLIKVNEKSPFYTLGAKTMMLKIYYEQKEYEPLVSLLKSFEMYLRAPKKVSANHVQAHQNMIRFIRILLRKHNPDRIRTSFAELRDTNPIMEKQWLVRKFQFIQE